MSQRLLAADSLYLRQHAEQPVDWYPWGEDALQRARAEDKPIFLSIGYSSCHWCHVMARESFADAEVAARLRENFIAVKVDREERPDLDQIYMLACQFFTGSGGWPLSVFMSPDGVPFFAGTYFPKRGAAGLQMPGFIEIINYLGQRWHHDRESLLKGGREVVRLLNSYSENRPEAMVLSDDVLALAADQLAENFDREAGGFGDAPKFPAAHQLLFLLRWYRRSQAPIALEMVETSLRCMAAGGVFDQLAGGFHRYSVDKDWRIPHFEKMLYDQAALLMAYTEAQAASPRPLYGEIAAAIVAFLEHEMLDEGGGFYASIDADSEGCEGAAYIWRRDQILDALGAGDGEFFCQAYGVNDEGNFADEPGCSVLYRAALPEADEPRQRLARLREQLLSVRRRRPQPTVDRKMITAWNGLMAAALARAAVVFEQPGYLRLAEAAVRAILPASKEPLARLVGKPQSQAFLDDYAFVIAALLELHEADAGPGYLDQARELMTLAIAEFADDGKGFFLFSGRHSEKLLARLPELHDGALPASNSTMILNLLRLAAADDSGGWRERAEKGLSLGLAGAQQAPLHFLQLLSALDEYLR